METQFSEDIAPIIEEVEKSIKRDLTLSQVKLEKRVLESIEELKNLVKEEIRGKEKIRSKNVFISRVHLYITWGLFGVMIVLMIMKLINYY